MKNPHTFGNVAIQDNNKHDHLVAHLLFLEYGNIKKRIFMNKMILIIVLLASVFTSQLHASPIEKNLAKECYSMSQNMETLSINEPFQCVQPLMQASTDLYQAGHQIELNELQQALVLLETVRSNDFYQIEKHCPFLNNMSTYRHKVDLVIEELVQK